MKKEKCDAFVTVRLPKSYVEILRITAKDNEWTLSHLIRRLVIDSVDAWSGYR